MAFKDEEKEEGKFNLGLATLESINDILVEIKRASIQGLLPDADEGVMQYMKHKLCRQLLIRASPLFEGEKIKEGKKNEQDLEKYFRDRLSNIQLKTEIIKGNKGENLGIKRIYNKEVEDNLDNFITEVTMKLQELRGSFNPSREDEGL